MYGDSVYIDGLGDFHVGRSLKLYSAVFSDSAGARPVTGTLGGNLATAGEVLLDTSRQV